MSDISDIPVLIAGGGTVGLATAVFLGHHGVPATRVLRGNPFLSRCSSTAG